ncbi:lineage-specific thermal regulator protein [Eubacteriaceae bacterium CHKCI004]|nr:lineage-specific thermal regulator protein [Eubacteriaceae bacterium CHKCI004]
MHRRNSFKKGSMEMLILILLHNEDCYGYELSQKIKEQSENSISITEGSLYPALYRLAEKGYISDYKKQVGKRLTRVYYHLEPDGEIFMKSLIQDYLEVHRGIQKIFCINHVNMDNNEGKKI